MSVFQKNYQVVVQTYPDIAKRFKMLWGSQAFTDFMHELLNDTRDHGREGFPKEVVVSFLKLQEVHDHLFPSMSETSYGARAAAYGLSEFGKL